MIDFERRVAALAQFRVLDPSRPTLDPEDDRHLRAVLRARAGEEVVVSDGRGRWRLCVVTPDGVDPVTDVRVDPDLVPSALYLAPLKGDRTEWALVKAVELGVTDVTPLLTARAAVRWRAEARTRVLARWRRLASEAAGQCRRTHDLVIHEPVGVMEVPAEVAVADVGGSSDWRGVRAVAIGPEGGWAHDEWLPARRRVSLGPLVLRGETAAVAAATLLGALGSTWGWRAGHSGIDNDEWR